MAINYTCQIAPTTRKITPAATTTITNNMCNVSRKSYVNNLQASCSLPLLSMLFLAIVLTLSCLLTPAAATEPLKVIYAVNAGGDRHTDQNGIHYTADTLKVGIASDYGKHLLMIGRVQEQDELLYRTERYHTTTFGYDFPADGDGDYALIMKFCEVYFDAPNRKVFDVLLNRRHTVIKQLDIYNKVGRGSAHDEIVYFKISNGRLHYEAEGEIETSDVRNGQLRLDFIKGALDNPKINAFALLKGDMSQLPRLYSAEASDRHVEADDEEKPRQLLQERIVRYNEKQAQRGSDDDADEDEDDYDGEEQTQQQQQKQPQQQKRQSQQQEQQQEHQQQPQQQQQSTTHNSKRIRSGPRQPNPYSMDDSSILMPVFVAICAFIPLLFCLCKL